MQRVCPYKFSDDIKLTLEIIGKIVTPSILLILLFTDIPELIMDFGPTKRSYSLSSIAWFTSVLILIHWIIDIPFSIYGEIIERRFDFSTRSNRRWIRDQLVSLIIFLVLSLVIVELIYYTIHISPDFWWFFGFIGYFVFTSVLSALTPLVLIPLFMDLTPLEEGEVRNTVENIAKRIDLDYQDIYNLKMSDMTKKSNAAVVGFGSTLRIVLGDTLIENFRTDEIETVMAHEIAHQKNKDIYRNIIIGGLISLISFILIDLGYETAISMFDYLGKDDPLSIVYFSFALLLISEFTTVFMLWYSRRREKAADVMAIEETRDIDVYKSTFGRLAKENLAYPDPSMIEVMLRYSHPPIKERIKYGEELAKKLEKD